MPSHTAVSPPHPHLPNALPQCGGCLELYCAPFNERGWLFGNVNCNMWSPETTDDCSPLCIKCFETEKLMRISDGDLASEDEQALSRASITRRAVV